MASEITDWLFLGDNQVARNKQLLESHGITYIMNCAEEACANYFDDVGFAFPFPLLDFFSVKLKLESLEIILANYLFLIISSFHPHSHLLDSPPFLYSNLNLFT